MQTQAQQSGYGKSATTFISTDQKPKAKNAENVCETSIWKRSTVKTQTLLQRKQKMQEFFHIDNLVADKKTKVYPPTDLMSIPANLQCYRKTTSRCAFPRSVRNMGSSETLSPGPGAYMVKLPASRKNFRNPLIQDFNHSFTTNHCHNIDPTASNPPMGSYNVHKETPINILPWNRTVTQTHARLRPPRRDLDICAPVNMYTPPSASHDLFTNKLKGPFLKGPRQPKKEIQRNIIAATRGCPDFNGPLVYEAFYKSWHKPRTHTPNWKCTHKTSSYAQNSAAKKSLPGPGRYDTKTPSMASVYSCSVVFDSKVPRNHYTAHHLKDKDPSSSCVPHCILYDTHQIIQ